MKKPDDYTPPDTIIEFLAAKYLRKPIINSIIYPFFNLHHNLFSTFRYN